MMTTTPTDPFVAFPAETLEVRRITKSPRVKAVERFKLLELAEKVAKKKVTLPETAVMTLTARHPHDPAGFMDAYHPGRWDCEWNLVFMTAIHQVGPSVGEWDGTVIYARFTAPTSGTYLVVGNHSGYQTTMNLNGPWGKTTAYCPTTSDTAQATALWTGAAGSTLFFTINLTGPIMGYLESIQVFELS